MELVVLTDVPSRMDWERSHQIAARLPAALGATDRNGLVVWLSTPAALRQARELRPDVLVYDVEGYLPGYEDALEAADLVFTGGRSLQRAISTFRADAHCFANGVDAAHFSAVPRRPGGRRPVAGYVGVVDDRLDFELLRQLAAALPDWDVRVVEPPSYAALPGVMAELDVGLLPFVLDERTPSISPSKTLEYLAAGIPVVATRMPDVADAFSDVVALEEGGLGFAAACMRVVGDDPESRADRAHPLLKWHHWDTVVGRMAQVITEHARKGAEMAV